MAARIAILATGGTIASRYDAAAGRTVACARVGDLIAAIPGLGDVATFEGIDFATRPSFDFTPDFVLSLAREANAVLASDDITGLVVTHGTDTMEESAYLTDLLLDTHKPVVFTGAQRAQDDPFADGPANLLDAARVAAAPDARGLGALVCFNGEIHAARDVQKMHASALGTFQSPGVGALGFVDGAAVTIHRRPLRRCGFPCEGLESRIVLIRLAMGCDSSLIDAAVAAGARAVVIEAFGRGNGPAALAAAIARATAAGVAVVVTSRCPAGRVQPVYGGGGGGRDLADAGAIFAGDLKGPKARMLLMVLLGNPDLAPRVAEILAEVAP